MSVATGTAIAIGVGAGTSILGGVLSSKAAKHASEQQAQSAQQALALQQQQYQQTREDLSPYRTQGGQGLTALTALLGLPAAPAAGAGAGKGGPMPAGFAPTGTPGEYGGSMSFGTGGLPGARQGAMGGAAPNQSAYAPPPAGVAAGGTVLLRAPNGQTQAVPADQVNFYLARGATRG